MTARLPICLYTFTGAGVGKFEVFLLIFTGTSFRVGMSIAAPLQEDHFSVLNYESQVPVTG